MSICYVSMYYYIDRTNWPDFKRDRDEYIKNFIPFINLFRNNTKDTFYVFIDERVKDDSILTHANIANIIFIPINLEFMLNNFRVWKYIEEEKEIMQSESFKQLIKDRTHCPETFCAEYNLINHSKNDAIKYIIDNVKPYDYYTWVDFGYFKNNYIIPKNLLDLSKLDLNRINRVIINDITKDDENIEKTMKSPSETIAGYFFFGNRNVMLQYFELYQKELEKFYSLNLVDDDQHISLRCYFEKPYLFRLCKMPWHHALKYYS